MNLAADCGAVGRAAGRYWRPQAMRTCSPQTFAGTFFLAGNGLIKAIEWLCTSGQLTEPFKDRNFEAS